MNDEIQAALMETTKTRETAQRLADGDYPGEADHIRVLAGLIGQLAEQVERLAQALTSGETPVAVETLTPNEAEAPTEEDRTPEDAPAEPLDDRSKG